MSRSPTGRRAGGSHATIHNPAPQSRHDLPDSCGLGVSPRAGEPSNPLEPRSDDPDGVLQRLILDGAWMDGLHWAISDERMQAEFKATTGRDLSPPASVIEGMVDDATGKRKADVEAFVRWWTETYFGAEYAPPEYRKGAAG